MSDPTNTVKLSLEADLSAAKAEIAKLRTDAKALYATAIAKGASHFAAAAGIIFAAGWFVGHFG